MPEVAGELRIDGDDLAQGPAEQGRPISDMTATRSKPSGRNCCLRVEKRQQTAGQVGAAMNRPNRLRQNIDILLIALEPFLEEFEVGQDDGPECY